MILVVVVAILAALAAFYVFFNTKKIAPKTKVVVLGPSGAGKTSLLLQLTGSTCQTVVSQTATTYQTEWGPTVDTPGSNKLEILALDQLVDQKLVVFMVDATASLKDAVQKLYNVLLVAEKTRTPVLIAANKYDLFSTISVSRVKATLESEINELRQTREKALNEDNDWLGSEEPFRFEHLGIDCEVLDGSVKAGRVQKWTEFILSY